MDKIFESVFKNGMDVGTFFLCMAVCLVSGLILSLMSFFKGQSSRGFYITTAILPCVVAMVIALVNGNLGVGIAVAGAFSLVRFRSSPWTAKEICIIFIAMASGLAYGMGYLAYGIIFTLIAGLFLMLLQFVSSLTEKPMAKDKLIKITIPEDIDYTEVFDEVLKKYTTKYELIKVKSVNMGSMFKITYHINLKNSKFEKELIDDIRIRNGNLEVVVERTNYDINAL